MNTDYSKENSAAFGQTIRSYNHFIEVIESKSVWKFWHTLEKWSDYGGSNCRLCRTVARINDTADCRKCVIGKADYVDHWATLAPCDVDTMEKLDVALDDLKDKRDDFFPTTPKRLYVVRNRTLLTALKKRKAWLIKKANSNGRKYKGK